MGEAKAKDPRQKTKKELRKHARRRANEAGGGNEKNRGRTATHERRKDELLAERRWV